MKRLALVLVALSLPVFAADPPPPPPEVIDSPMVAAAKRSNRLGKKPAFVITHETLALYRGGGHITTTTTPRTLNVPVPAPTPEMIAALEKADQARVAAATQAVQKKPVSKVRPYDDAEQLYGDDVTYDPGEDRVAQPAPAQTPPPQKP